MNIRFGASSLSGILQIRRHAVVAQVSQRMAARTIVHEVARTALQGLHVPDVRAGMQQRDFPFLGHDRDARQGKSRQSGDRDQQRAPYHVSVTLSGTGFTRSNLVYQGISRKNAKYRTVQTLASSG